MGRNPRPGDGAQGPELAWREVSQLELDVTQNQVPGLELEVGRGGVRDREKRSKREKGEVVTFGESKVSFLYL